MYGWLWHQLPGPAAVRVLILTVAALAVLAVVLPVGVPGGRAVHAVQRDHGG